MTAGRQLVDYSADRLLRQAAGRNFEIIGEAIKRLAQHGPATASGIDAYAQIIAFRNVLINGYDLVDHALVWNAIEQQLPALQRDVESLLGHSASPP